MAKKLKRPQNPVVKSKVKSKDEISVLQKLTNDILETAKINQKLIDKLEQPFELRDLYKVAEQNKFPHPILTVGHLRDAKILKCEGEGLFVWNR